MSKGFHAFATDPPVSEKQRRAMYAAAVGHSTLGIPKKVGKEFIGKDMTDKDWADLRNSFAKFLDEEEEEPEHSEDEDGEEDSDEELPASDMHALDEASVRSEDKDGHLHVARTPISKANVCPYIGREIPNWQALGLDPNRTYRLYRHADELKKGAETFNNKPLLSKHVPVDADNHPADLVVGSLGTNAEFDPPYLYNSLAVYTREAIEGVKDKTKRELSSAYRYRADMTPGTSPEGEPYDGVMRDIVGNHVALVPAGRAGSDVVVGDEVPTQPKESHMKTVLSRKASVTKGVLMSYLRPRLAQDAKLNLTPLLAGITNDNYSKRRVRLLADLTKSLEGKLAADAKIDDLSDQLMALDEVNEPDEKEEAKDKKARDKKGKDAKGESEEEKAEDESEEEKAEDESEEDDDKPWDKAKDYARSKGMDEEDLDAMDAIMRAGCDSEEDEEDEKKGKDKKARDKKGRDSKALDKHAMDAAITRAVSAAERRVMANQQAIREAERAVRPWVGELNIAFDSADEVYAHTLEALGEDIEDIHPSAYPAILKRIPQPGQREARRSNGIAQDAANSAGLLATLCPDAARIELA